MYFIIHSLEIIDAIVFVLVLSVFFYTCWTFINV